MFGNLSLKYKIIAGSLAPLVLIVIINLFTIRDFNKLNESLNMVNFTNEVIIDARTLQKYAIDLETGERGYLLTGKKEFLEPYDNSIENIKKLFFKLQNEVSFNQQQIKLLKDAQDQLNKWIKQIATVYIDQRKALDLNNNPDASKLMGQEIAKEKGKEIFDQFREKMDIFIENEYKLLDARMKSSKEQTDATNKLMVSAIVIALIFSMIISIYLTKMIVEPLYKLKESALQISKGNLSITLDDIKRDDEIGSLSKSFQAMVVNLEKMLAELGEGIGVIASSVSQILATTNQLSSSAAETASSVTETSTTVQEVRQTSQLNASKAQSMESATQKAMQDSKAGQENLAENTQGLVIIQQSMQEIANNILSLSEQSKLISDIVFAVEDIASQSKILSVNASIEAVKAGENGKGFSVVAQELKTLAEQSKEGTTKVQKILDDIQGSMNSLVMITEKGSKSVQSGIDKAQNVSKSFEVLQETITEAAKVSRQIAASSEQEDAGMKQIVEAMKNIQVVSKQNADAVVQVESAVNSLSQLSSKLKKMSSNYDLKKK